MTTSNVSAHQQQLEEQYRALLAERTRAEEALGINERRLAAQKEAFEAAVDGAPLHRSLGVLARIVTAETGGAARTAFYVADQSVACLHPIPDAGDMPPSYTAKVDRFPIGLESLACGLATATGRPILTRDVFEEPLWKPWVHLAREFDFRGCWSFPIETRDRRPIGTLALYFREARDAQPQDLALAAVVTQAAGIIISRQTEVEERARVERALRESEEKYRSLFNLMDEAFVLCEVVLDHDDQPVDLRYVDANPAAVRMMGAEPVGRTARGLELNLEPHWFTVFDRVARTGTGERHELTATAVNAVYNVYVFPAGAPNQHRVAAIYQDVTDRKRADERQSLLMRELNHRVKNTLATVQSIANQTFRGAPEPALFVEKFQARLQALSRAHALLTQRNWQSADIRAAVRDQLALDGDNERIPISGPAVFLAPSSAVSLAMVLHELATNARKHGSLSTAAGRVNVQWRVTGTEPAIHLEWQESGGPAIEMPTKRGFGITLIEKSLAGIGGSASLQFEAGGLRCSIRLPFAEDQAPVAPSPAD
jgi:two-component sensor histidine kinase